MRENQEKRNTKIIDLVIGDTNRLHRKDDTPPKKKLVETVTRISQRLSYLSSVSEKDVETELEQGHIHAIGDGTGEIEAYVRYLPISDEDSFILTLHGKTMGQVVEVL